MGEFLMDSTPSTPWHKTSFDRFLHERLQELLMTRLRLSGYHAEPTEAHECRIVLRASGPGGDIEVTYSSLPAPNDEGVFQVDEADLIVLPIASCDDLAQATIRCVGERLYDFIESRLGTIPADTALDESLLEAVAPLATWFRGFLAQEAELVQDNNWLARHAHIRRLFVPNRRQVFTPGHFGRTCPFETPEGPNVGRILTISRGAEIRDDRLIIVDDDPVASLGTSAAAIPFIEHDDGNRVLMGANMMRQWLPPAERETALVQTDLEPGDADEFWCGRNLLTAFISWDGYAFEDAVVISESCARKLSCPQALEPGDKLSNRHGTKGVVGQVLPDEEMPRLDDGTPVELIFSLSGVPSRWTMGQIREAALSRWARANGQPAIVPPYGAPSDDELRQLLRDASLPENGMETLSVGKTRLRRSCTVGWVYWGCTNHLAREKIHASISPHGPCQRVGAMEVSALREAGAFAVVREFTNTSSSERDDAEALAHRVSAGEVEQPKTPSPRFVKVTDRLAAAGICAELDADGLRFAAREPDGDALELARPVEHPWFPDQMLARIGTQDGSDQFQAVKDASDRLSQLQDKGAPRPLTDNAHRQLIDSVRFFFDGLLSTRDLRFGLSTRALFSGRSVAAPGPELQIDQLGLPEKMAWMLFSPIVSRILGDPEATRTRTGKAREALEKSMAAAWVIVNRAPSMTATSFLAFQPVLCRGHAIRLHPIGLRADRR